MIELTNAQKVLRITFPGLGTIFMKLAFCISFLSDPVDHASWHLLLLWMLYFEHSFCCDILQILDLKFVLLEILEILDVADLGS